MILSQKKWLIIIITMTRGIKRFLFCFVLMFAFLPSALAYERIGIVSDAILTQINPYNAYFKTPEFFLQDVRGNLVKSGVSVVSVASAQRLLNDMGVNQYDIETLGSLKQGYDLDYALLKKICRAIGVKKLIVMTSSVDIQRDFLKNTLWNVANIQGMDVVNPTHRLSVYVAFVDVEHEIVLWEQIYAKNIRNNKFKNLDTTISANYEGMLRLKEYSKYISPEIAKQVRMRLIDPSYTTPPVEINRGNVVKYFKDMKNIGTRKRLTDIDAQRWDTEKLKDDTLENIETKKNGFVDWVKNLKRSDNYENL